MMTRIVKMTFQPEAVAVFLDNFSMHKESIRGFKGCEKLLLLRDKDNEQVFFTYSWWQSEDDLQAYRQSDLFKGIWSQTKLYFAAKPQAWSVNEIESL